MTSNSSSSYAYYSFPATPNRSSPKPKSNSSTPKTTSKSETMAPSPAAGKATGGAPRTPTKLGRKPQSSQTPKLGQASSNTPASGAKKAPPKLESRKPEAETPEAPEKPESEDAAQQASEAAEGAQDKAGEAAQDVKEKSEDAPKEASNVEMKDTTEAPSTAAGDDEDDDEDDDDDEGPLSKVSQAGDQTKGQLEEQDPQPIDDSNDDAVGGAQEATEGAADNDDDDDDDEDAEDDNATEKAGDTADDTADDATDDAQDTAGKVADDAQDTTESTGGNLLKGAQGLAGKASGLAGKAAKDPKKAAQDVSGDVQETVEDTAQSVQDTAGDAAEKAQDTAEDVADNVEDAADDAQDTAEDVADDVEDAADDAQDTAEDVADDAQDTAEGVADDAQDTAEDTTEQAQDTAEDATEQAQDVAEDAEDTAADATDKAQDTAEDVEDDGADVADDAEDTAEDAADKTAGATDATDAADAPKDTADDVKDKTEDAAEDAGEDAEGVADDAKDTAEDADQDAEDAGEKPAKVEDISELPLDLSVLKGLEVNEDGVVYDNEGNAIGKLAEGDAEDLAGYPIGDDGEILDDDGDLVGRCELMPDEVRKQMSDLKQQGELPEGAEDLVGDLPEVDDAESDDAESVADSVDPGLSILKGLTCDSTGLIFNDDGDTVGQVVDGDPQELQNATLNERGEFVDEDGNVVGHASLHEEAEGLAEQAREEAQVAKEEAQEAAGDAKDGAEDAKDGAEDAQDGAEDAQDGAEDAGDAADEAVEAAEDAKDTAEGIEDELPGIEALEGKELNEAGEILDDQGNLLGHIEDQDLKDQIESGEINADDLKINESGEVVNEEGDVLGKVGLAEGAAQYLAGPINVDIRILDGRKVNKKGKVLDDEGEEIGELTEGEAKDCAGKKINDKGQVLDNDGNVVGKVSIIPGEAAEEATRALQEELGENEPEADEDQDEEAEEGEQDEEAEEDEQPTGPQFKIPDLDVLEGLKVNKKGKILNEDGEEIGELTSGELSECTGKKVNATGEVLDEEGNVIGRVKALEQEIPAEELEQAQEAQEAAEDAQDGAEEAQEGAEEAQEGAEDAQADAEDAAEDAEDAGPELPPLSILDGLSVNKAGKLVDSNGTIVGELVEGEAKKLSKSGITSDDQGQFWDSKGHVIGRAKTIALEDPDEESPFAGLEGLIVVKDGYVEDENGNRVGEVVEGNAKKLIGRSVDEDGDIIDKKGTVVGHADRYEEPEEEAEPEAEPEDLSSLTGRTVNKMGMVIGDEGVPVARLVEGNAKDLAGKKLDDQGQIWDDQGKVIGRVEMIPEAERETKPEGPFAGLEGLRVVANGLVADEDENVVGEITEGNPKRLIGLRVDEDGDIIDKYGNVKGHADVLPDEEEEAPIDNSILNGLKLNKQGFVVNEEGIPVGKLVDGNVKELAGRACDENGDIFNDTGKAVGHCEVLPEDERVAKPEGPFAGLEGLRVIADGKVADEDDNIVGEITEGNPKRLVGHRVDEDGDIIDKYGNVKGHADVLPEEEEVIIDNSLLDGKKLNKQGFVVNEDGIPVGKLVEGNVKEIAGRLCDENGDIHNDTGKVVGHCEVLPEDERVAKPEGPFAGLEGLRVIADGKIADEDDNVVGEITEGNAKRLIGLRVDEDGDIIDKYGNVKGHADVLPEEEEVVIDNSLLDGKALNKQGFVVNEEGIPVGKLVEGNVLELAGRRCDENGDIHGDTGKVVGHCDVLPENERVARAEGPFAGLEGLRVIAGGKVADEDGNVVGEITEGNAKRLIGLRVDEDGDIIDKYGNVKGHAEQLPEEEDVVVDNSLLDGKKLTKGGFVVNEEGIPIGKLVEGNVLELAGRRCDENGDIHGDTGKVVGHCEVLPENERVARPEGPFAGLEGLHVNREGLVEDADGNVVGVITEGNAKRLVGLAVDEDGDINDKFGNVKGHAEPYEEETQAEADLSSLDGCTVNKAGNVVDSAGAVVGRVAEGDPSHMIGSKVDGKGQIWDNGGNVIGRAEVVRGQDNQAEGPFAGFDDITFDKEGMVVTPDGSIVGRVVDGDLKKLVAHKVDEDGEILDKNGNSIGKAERWEPEEKERKVNPMAGRRVNKEGEVRDDSGNLMGRLTAGDLGHCAGLEIDDNGYVIDNDGNKVGEVTLLENLLEEIPEEELTDEERELLKQREEDRQIAEKMGTICTQTLERVQPVCKQITDLIEKADRTPREELDEEQLVNDVKPLIEEGGRILQECNGSLRGLDPDGRIAAQAKGRAGTKEATPEEYRLADTLKELTTTVVTCIDNAKKRISDMPLAKKKLNPLWGLMTQPLFQILAAVGLLLTGVLGLVGQLLNGLGLGGLVNGLLGGLGIDKLLGGLGLGSVASSLGLGKKDKKKSGGGASSIPLIGGLFGKK